mmetsp:Transcript_54696/g.123064  ORF Transcript_54696/g.123064 Transcript_54696/m.123064 type:complete len:333 (-) Transcript_54696:81-1079(-)|eukprot:CAMPEP_0197891900 /NCGR_PEP_ID=MMETSP1439-20131203/29858_1 /TAXON_ID=66791 /ORGANISM="Gonyaulax spinifera, Strain CCMP409" /LENGTH=332 /DNA_ID=CAMNT_0043512039 /DNA_START=45 /DNA_END=1043 /DNA_ORIENTATION=+
MATLQRYGPQEESLWSRVRHSAGSVCQRGGAYLSGQYQYVFHNETQRTVKMHLQDDLDVAAAKRNAGQRQSDYYLTLPPQTRNVEIPMRSGMVIVTAGFFHSDRVAYEIFWDSRRFAWEPNSAFAIKPRHSIDVNQFRVDVAPQSPEAPPRKAGVCEEYPIFTMSGASTHGQTTIVCTCVEGEWTPAAVTGVLPGGELQLDNGTFKFVVNPSKQSMLLVQPATFFQGDQPLPLDAPEVVGSLQPPSWKSPAQVETIVEIPCVGPGAAEVETIDDFPYLPGQKLQVYSQTKSTWVDAQVTKVTPGGSVTVQYVHSASYKTLQPQDTKQMLRTV